MLECSLAVLGRWVEELCLGRLGLESGVLTPVLSSVGDPLGSQPKLQLIGGIEVKWASFRLSAEQHLSSQPQQQA